jgi:cysteinyl-tRNA synthetase
MKGIERLVRAVNADVHESATHTIDAQPYQERFIEAMDDDFNTPQAMAVLFDLAREINIGHDEGLGIRESQELLRELAGVLGLALKDIFVRPCPIETEENVPAPEVDIDKVNALIKERDKMRSKKQWQRADEIREELGQLGITLEDTPQGTVWRYKKP